MVTNIELPIPTGKVTTPDGTVYRLTPDRSGKCLLRTGRHGLVGELQCTLHGHRLAIQPIWGEAHPIAAAMAYIASYASNRGYSTEVTGRVRQVVNVGNAKDILAASPGWQARAQCRNDTTFLEWEEVDQRIMCSRCPVSKQCVAMAIDTAAIGVVAGGWPISEKTPLTAAVRGVETWVPDSPIA